jgi:hypothetical protein
MQARKRGYRWQHWINAALLGMPEEWLQTGES